MEQFQHERRDPPPGLPAPPAGKISYYIPCPCCDDKPKSRHLNVNLRKDVFRCPRCGFSGGVFDLYAYYARIPRSRCFPPCGIGCLCRQSGIPSITLLLWRRTP